MSRQNKDIIIKGLKERKFDNIELNKWFLNCEFEYIFAILEGLSNNTRNRFEDLLHFIIIYANQLLNNPRSSIIPKEYAIHIILDNGLVPVSNFNALEFSSNDQLMNILEPYIKENCLNILIQSVDLIMNSYYDTTNQDDLWQLSKSQNDMLRLAICSYGRYNSLTSYYLDDSSPRVRKVAHIINNFNKMKNDDDYSKSLNYIDFSLKNGIIECNISGKSEYEDKIDITFSSLLFKEDVLVRDFDRDIFSTIKDKKILAWAVRELIEEGIITFRDSMVPKCFDYLSYLQNANNSVLKRTLIPENN